MALIPMGFYDTWTNISVTCDTSSNVKNPILSCAKKDNIAFLTMGLTTNGDLPAGSNIDISNISIPYSYALGLGYTGTTALMATPFTSQSLRIRNTAAIANNATIYILVILLL